MSSRASTANQYRRVAIPAGGVTLPGVLAVPTEALGAVIFAHGSGSSHRSLRNLRVAGALSEAGFVTLLFDLLTAEEGRYRPNVFDVPLLAERLETGSQSELNVVTRQPDTSVQAPEPLPRCGRPRTTRRSKRS